MALAQTRPVGLNELRCVARQSLDLYRTLLVGGVYTFDGPQQREFEPSLRKAVKYCVARHPILSAVIENEDTQDARFAKPDNLNIKNHVYINQANADRITDQSSYEALIERLHDTTLTDREKIPPWRVYVHPFCLKDSEQLPGDGSYLILFGYYHSHGDGMAGTAFAKTLLEGLNMVERGANPFDASDTIQTSEKPFLLPVEKLAVFPISWSFLLAPLLGEYLPRFVAKRLGFRASVIPQAGDHWTGHRLIDSKGLQTGAKMLSVPDSQVQAMLQACRKRDCRLTGLLHQLVVRALSDLLSADTPAGCFVSQSAVDMRRVIDGLTDDDMALCVTGYYETFPRASKEHWADWITGDSSHPVWTAVRTTTQGLAEQAGRLTDQPVALLKYLSDMRRWTLDQIGKPREASYELSNLRAFDPPTRKDDVWSVESMVFSQPANMSGGCFDVNVVTRKGGDMTITLSWELGALAVADEKEFMAKVRRLIEGYIGEL